MKKILFSVLAMAAFAACSNEEQIAAPQGEAIAFGNAFVDNSVRADAATDPSYSTNGKGVALEKFNVYGAVNGVNIFNGNNVTKTAGYGEAWSCDGPKQYWIAGADYKFVGVVDGNKTVGETVVTKTNLDEAGLPSTIDYTVDGKTDLLCDVKTVNDATAPYSVVAFTYTHLLSKVKFSVKNTTGADATNYRFKLTSAKITGAYASGVYNVVANAEQNVEADSWTLGSTTRDYVLENLTINSNSQQYHSQEVLLLPGTVGVYVKADIEASDDNGATWKKVSDVEKTFLTAATLAKGSAYHFIVELGVGQEIKFTATEMIDWANGNTKDSDDDDTVNDYVPVN